MQGGELDSSGGVQILKKNSEGEEAVPSRRNSVGVNMETAPAVPLVAVRRNSTGGGTAPPPPLFNRGRGSISSAAPTLVTSEDTTFDYDDEDKEDSSSDDDTTASFILTSRPSMPRRLSGSRPLSNGSGVFGGVSMDALTLVSVSKILEQFPKTPTELTITHKTTALEQIPSDTVDEKQGNSNNPAANVKKNVSAAFSSGVAAFKGLWSYR